MVQRCEVRHVHPLGRLQSAGPGRMGDAGARASGRDVRVARHHVQSGEVRGARVGVARKGGRSEVHHDHVAPPRRLLDVRDPRDAVQHRGLDAVQARPAEAVGGRVPATRPQAVLLLFTARLASSRLLAARHSKSRHVRIGYLGRAAGGDANLLLTIAPRPAGTAQAAAAGRLRDVGRWLATHGGAIYATRAGPVPPREWGVTTRRADTVFVHVLSWPDRLLGLPPLGAPVVRASMLSTGARVDVTPSGSGVTLTLPAGGEDEPDRVVVLTLAAHRPKG